MVDPGARIGWKAHPAWTTSLVRAALALPRRRQHALLSLDSALDKAGKKQKLDDFRLLAESIFTLDPGPDGEGRRAKQAASVGRRLVSIGKEYKDHIIALNQEPATSRVVYLAVIQDEAPWWDSLHSILRDHPAYPGLVDDGGGAANGGAAVAGPGPAAMAHAAAAHAAAGAAPELIDLMSDYDDSDDAMQGIEYTPAHPPAVGFDPNLSPPPGDFDDPRSPAQTQCFNCQVELDPTSATEHMRRCFDGNGKASGIFTPECFVCGRDLQALASADRDRHINECVSKPVFSEDFDVFECTERNCPRDDEGQSIECTMCFDDFEPAQRLARLACFCVFHEACATAWWAPKADGSRGKFCPVHSADLVK